MILWPFQDTWPEAAEDSGSGCGPHSLRVPDPNDPGRCFYCLELLPGGTPGNRTPMTAT